MQALNRCACVFILALLAATAVTAQEEISPGKPVTLASAEPVSVASPAPYVAPYAGPIERLRPIEPAQPVVTERPNWKLVVDRKFIAVHAIAMSFTIADIERTQHCLGNGTCRELNPMLPLSRAGMYAVNVPINLAATYLSYRMKASGRKTWWIAPVAIGASHGVGFGFKF